MTSPEDLEAEENHSLPGKIMKNLEEINMSQKKMAERVKRHEKEVA